MKIFKLSVWAVLFFILQTVFADAIRIYGAVPDLLMVFAMIYSFYETDKTYLLFTVLSCCILAGSGVGREFSTVVLFTAAGCGATYIASEHLRFVPGIVRLFAVMMVFVFMLGFSEYFIAGMPFSVSDMIKELLVHTAYTIITAIVMYPFMMRTILYKPKKKLTVI